MRWQARRRDESMISVFAKCRVCASLRFSVSTWFVGFRRCSIANRFLSAFIGLQVRQIGRQQYFPCLRICAIYLHVSAERSECGFVGSAWCIHGCHMGVDRYCIVDVCSLHGCNICAAGSFQFTFLFACPCPSGNGRGWHAQRPWRAHPNPKVMVLRPVQRSWRAHRKVLPPWVLPPGQA